MAESAPARPPLFTSAPEPALNGGRCRTCGYVFFPFQTYGCEACGAGDLERKALRGRGALSSFATVHLYQGSDIKAPFTVGVIALDDGPSIRAILTEKTDASLKIGDRMRAVVIASAQGESNPELRFAREEQGR